MPKKKKISVVLPTYTEKGMIKKAILDFFASGVVDEVVVVNNNAVEGTDEEVKKTKARLVYEKKQGYGYALQKGLKEAKGEIIIMAEPDGTFAGRDVKKLLAYHEDGYEAVFGTRTTKGFIWEGANMSLMMKWGNIIVAKLIEFLFFCPCQLTDVGCTMKLFTRKALRKIQPYFTVGGSFFSPELIILTLLQGISLIEIPINYLPRKGGESTITGTWKKTTLLALRMIILVLSYRFKVLFQRHWAKKILFPKRKK